MPHRFRKPRDNAMQDNTNPPSRATDSGGREENNGSVPTVTPDDAVEAARQKLDAVRARWRARHDDHAVWDMDGDGFWEVIPGGKDELKTLEYQAAKEERRRDRVRIDAEGHADWLVSRDLGKRMYAEKQAAERGSFSSRTLHRAGLSELPKPKGLIPDVLYTGSVAVIYGPSTVGKTWVMLSLGGSAATGRAWPDPNGPSGRVGPIPVLYIAAEDGGGVDDRVAGWERAHGIQLAQYEIYFHPQPLNLLDDVQVDEIVKFIDEKKIRLVIVDTVATVLGGEEENNPNYSRLVANMRRPVTAMQKFGGGSVVLVAHPGKDVTKGPRGGYSLFADADIVWQLSGSIDAIEMTCTKWKAGPFRDPWLLHLDRSNTDAPHITSSRSSGGSTVTARDIPNPPDQMAEAVLKKAAAYGPVVGCGQTDIVHALADDGIETKANRVNEKFAVLVGLKLMEQKSRGRYFVTSLGQHAVNAWINAQQAREHDQEGQQTMIE
ncbi:AAA family ATPase [Streptomyces sp. NPDC047043]|uniref:AAA family ATPase n=1 Tax=Streptomyces sp. NPDC047043 TaxID=3154497 RepID=UPI0033C33C69